MVGRLKGIAGAEHQAMAAGQQQGRLAISCEELPKPGLGGVGGKPRVDAPLRDLPGEQIGQGPGHVIVARERRGVVIVLDAEDGQAPGPADLAALCRYGSPRVVSISSGVSKLSRPTAYATSSWYWSSKGM